MLNIDLYEVEKNLNLGWDAFNKYVNLVANNNFVDGVYTPENAREAMYFGFLMFCTNLGLDYNTDYEEIRNHDLLISLYNNARSGNPGFFEEIEIYANKKVAFTNEKNIHNLENELANFAKTLTDKLASIDIDKVNNALDVLNIVYPSEKK